MNLRTTIMNTDDKLISFDCFILCHNIIYRGLVLVDDIANNMSNYMLPTFV